MEAILICYEKCSTCKKAEKWLIEKGVPFTKRPIQAENPTREEIIRWQGQSGVPMKKWFNTSGQRYRELALKDRLDAMTDEEMAALLATDGMLVKRPILLSGSAVLVGFREEEWKKALGM